MKKIFFTVTLFLAAISFVSAQDERDRKDDDREQEDKKSFKEHLFTGGSIALGFSNNSFLVGGSPVFGYSLTKWADAGLVGNYNYTSYRDIYPYNDKIHQSVYGGGAFVKLYPVHFLFAQAQFEHNFIQQKYIPSDGGTTTTTKTEANSLLLGAGYTTNRDPEGGQPFFYLSILFDVLRNDFSPYTSNTGAAVPVLKAGVQVPLFQGGHRRYRDRY